MLQERARSRICPNQSAPTPSPSNRAGTYRPQSNAGRPRRGSALARERACLCTCSSPLRWRFARGMKNAQYFDTLTAYAIRDQVTGVGDRQFAGSRHSAGSPQPGLVSQQLNCVNDACDDLLCELRIILCDICGLFVKIKKCLAQPGDFQRLYAGLCHLAKTLLTSDGFAKSPASASCSAV